MIPSFIQPVANTGATKGMPTFRGEDGGLEKFRALRASEAVFKAAHGFPQGVPTDVPVLWAVELHAGSADVHSVCLFIYICVWVGE